MGCDTPTKPSCCTVHITAEAEHLERLSLNTQHDVGTASGGGASTSGGGAGAVPATLSDSSGGGASTSGGGAGAVPATLTDSSGGGASTSGGGAGAVPATLTDSSGGGASTSGGGAGAVPATLTDSSGDERVTLGLLGRPVRQRSAEHEGDRTSGSEGKQEGARALVAPAQFVPQLEFVPQPAGAPVPSAAAKFLVKKSVVLAVLAYMYLHDEPTQEEAVIRALEPMSPFDVIHAMRSMEINRMLRCRWIGPDDPEEWRLTEAGWAIAADHSPGINPWAC
jgi:hypothetical protein